MSNVIEEIYVVINLIENKKETIYFVPNYKKNKAAIDSGKIDELYTNSHLLKGKHDLFLMH